MLFFACLYFSKNKALHGWHGTFHLFSTGRKEKKKGQTDIAALATNEVSILIETQRRRNALVLMDEMISGRTWWSQTLYENTWVRLEMFRSFLSGVVSLQRLMTCVPILGYFQETGHKVIQWWDNSLWQTGCNILRCWLHLEWNTSYAILSHWWKPQGTDSKNCVSLLMTPVCYNHPFVVKMNELGLHKVVVIRAVRLWLSTVLTKILFSLN